MNQFSELSLAYAVHVNKGQGLTTETSGILTGGWQTDREHTYVAVSRAREQTQIYLSREDLGEQGLDTNAIERLAERMQHSRAQEASITKKIAEQVPERSPEQTRERTQQTEPAPQDPQIRERDLRELIQPEPERARDHDHEKTAERDPYIEQAIQDARNRQQAWEQGIDPDRENDRGYGIE